MADPTDVALAGVLVAGAVGILSPAIGIYVQRLQLRHTRELADTEELRKVLDDGLAAAREARVLLHRHYGRTLPPQLHDIGAQVALANSRIAIRLGEPHYVAEAYQSVVDELSEWTDIFVNIDEWLEKVDEDEINAALARADDRFHGALKRYTESARQLVGSRVPKP